MATYVVLYNWTDQGIRNVRESPKRVDVAREMASKYGCTLKELYSAMGAYDLIGIIEAPDDQAITKLNLSLASLGNVRTTTLKVFPESEFRNVVQAIS